MTDDNTSLLRSNYLKCLQNVGIDKNYGAFRF